jgi:hypothetical protein
MNTINWYRVGYLIRQTVSWREWHYQIRYRFFGLFQRAVRGYSDEDTWNFDSHLSRIIAGGLRHLSLHAHSAPASFYDRERSNRYRSHSVAQKAWKKWLTKTADAFERYADDFSDLKMTASMTKADAKSISKRYVKAYTHFHTVVLPDFAKHFPSLWN